MTESAPDPRPWICTLCSDRFAHDQPEGRSHHQTIYKPRSQEQRDRTSRKKAS